MSLLLKQDFNLLLRKAFDLDGDGSITREAGRLANEHLRSSISGKHSSGDVASPIGLLSEYMNRYHRCRTNRKICGNQQQCVLIVSCRVMLAVACSAAALSGARALALGIGRCQVGCEPQPRVMSLAVMMQFIFHGLVRKMMSLKFIVVLVRLVRIRVAVPSPVWSGRICGIAVCQRTMPAEVPAKSMSSSSFWTCLRNKLCRDVGLRVSRSCR